MDPFSFIIGKKTEDIQSQIATILAIFCPKPKTEVYDNILPVSRGYLPSVRKAFQKLQISMCWRTLKVIKTTSKIFIFHELSFSSWNFKVLDL